MARALQVKIKNISVHTDFVYVFKDGIVPSNLFPPLFFFFDQLHSLATHCGKVVLSTIAVLALATMRSLH